MLILEGNGVMYVVFPSLKLWKANFLVLRGDCAPPHSFRLIPEPVLNRVKENEVQGEVQAFLISTNR